MKTRYTKKFKQEAVALSKKDGNSSKQVAEDLGIHIETLCYESSQPNKHGRDAFPGSWLA